MASLLVEAEGIKTQSFAQSSGDGGEEKVSLIGPQRQLIGMWHMQYYSESGPTVYNKQES